jgi:Ras-related protein Rab-6A
MYIEDKVVILNLWDTAGQERFKSLIPSYIKDSAVAIVIFDITSRASFQSVEKWIEDARAMRDDEVLLVLAGNKCDLQSHRQVTTQEAEEFARARNLLYMEVSAKEGINVVETFNEVAKKLTGIETNPIKQSEIKNTGFTL